MKQLVSIGRKKNSKGGYSLFLDWTMNGLRHKEYLKMYLQPETDKFTRLVNAETMKAAEVLRAQKVIDLQNRKAGIKRARDMYLDDYIEELKGDYEKQGKPEYVKTLTKMQTWLAQYGNRVVLADVDRDYLLGFYAFLRDPKLKQTKKRGMGRPISEGGLSEGTVCAYYQVLNTCLNTAVRKGYIDYNPQLRIERYEKPHVPESERNFLTLDELKAVAAVKTSRDEVKDMFLFSCFTGLRYSDVLALTWDDIQEREGGRVIVVRQKKTGRMVYVPLGDNAQAYLPEKGTETTVFNGMPGHGEVNRRVRDMCAKAGVTKHITFHCARHTYATLLLTYGADLYTVSKLLGHTNVSTTQIYAKVIDRKKREAVSLIPKL